MEKINQIIPLPDYLIQIKERNTEKLKAIQAKQAKRVNTKYLFNDKLLNKGRLVFEVVKHYNESNRHLTFEELQKKFSSNLQGSTGVINSLDFVNQKYSESERKRHFVDEDDILISADKIQFVVSTEWGIGNINNIVELARKENYKIEVQNFNTEKFELDLQKVLDECEPDEECENNPKSLEEILAAL